MYFLLLSAQMSAFLLQAQVRQQIKNQEDLNFICFLIILLTGNLAHRVSRNVTVEVIMHDITVL